MQKEHTDIRTYFEKKRGWWIEEKSTVTCILPPEGLLAVFKRSDVEPILDVNYPHRWQGWKKVWYFNNSYDREIAEVDAENRIAANPQILYKHFLGA